MEKKESVKALSSKSENKGKRRIEKEKKIFRGGFLWTEWGISLCTCGLEERSDNLNHDPDVRAYKGNIEGRTRFTEGRIETKFRMWGEKAC